MRLHASNKALLALFCALAVLSLGIKAAVAGAVTTTGDLTDARVRQVLVDRLRKQRFSTSVRELKIESSIVYGTRDGCRLSVRNAAEGTAVGAQFADDARGIGPVAYLYNGRILPSPPTLQMHAANVEASLLRSFGMRPEIHVPLALAKSGECGDNTFGLDDVSLAN